MAQAEQSFPVHEVVLPAGRSSTLGDLTVPPHALGMVLFAHGSGSSRLSDRNRHVATVLNAGRLATLLFDLLTPTEERVDAVTGQIRFDIRFLSHRLQGATEAIRNHPSVVGLPMGYFGASTGAAAALVAATVTPNIRAVVSRGGRIDLAGPAISQLRVPILAIVGDRDPEVLSLNRAALAEMQCSHRLEVIPGASHLFEEPGTLDSVARLARNWFTAHLPVVALP